MLKSLDLFSGYGGITLALEPYCRPIAYVEIEEYAQRIIAERMADGSLPRASILADVKNIEGKPGVCDIIVGGFPCQNISVAGDGKGLAGERSGLFYEITRLTKEIQPSFIFLENVPALRTRGLYNVAEEFTALGYDCRWTVVSASHVGAPHQRKRFFLLANSRRQDGGRKQGRSPRKGGKISAKSRNNGQDWPLADTKPKGLSSQRKSRGLQETQGSRPSARSQRGSSSQDWGAHWAIEPNVGRVVNGTPFRVDRIKALGNGVVPEQARLAFEYLMGIKTQQSEE